MATIIQISKIQLRRGQQADMPGAPSSLNPLVFSTGLDVGEMAFTTDTQRLFIGNNPGTGNPNFQRTSFPYQNVEVLTEGSTAANQGVFDAHERDVRTAFYVSALAPSARSWVSLTQINSSAAFQFDLSGAAGACARISYYLFDASPVAKPLRAGTMTLLSTGSTTTPVLSDEFVSTTAGASGDPVTAFGAISFQAINDSSTGSPLVAVQYLNSLSFTPTLLFRVERASPVVAPSGQPTSPY